MVSKAKTKATLKKATSGATQMFLQTLIGALIVLAPSHLESGQALEVFAYALGIAAVAALGSVGKNMGWFGSTGGPADAPVLVLPKPEPVPPTKKDQ